MDSRERFYATISENDYVDAGHIRLGEKATFQPKSMI